MENRANYYSFDYITALHYDNKKGEGNCMGCCVVLQLSQKNFLHFFLAKNRNERKERKIWEQRNQQKQFL